MARVLLAMSGGVDSSVAAALLQEQGHEVIGVFMRHGQAAHAACQTPDSTGGAGSSSAVLPVLPLAHKQGCCTASDAADGRRVADKLDIPFYALNFEEEFTQIIDYFVDEYTHGRTPNPCIMCNNWLKFGRLREYADTVDAQFIATGHYARLLTDDADSAPPALCRGLDEGKDQSYVLFGIDRRLLPRLMFPVGHFRKTEIRARAQALGLRVADKKDSQEICFVTSGHYAEFVQQRCEEGQRRDGEIITTTGEVVARHDGIERFTVGQRKGLGVAMGEPYFVIRVEPDSRRVVIGKKEELARSSFTAACANWLIDPPREPLRCQVKIRYLSRPAPATVHLLEEGRFQVSLDQPKQAIAPGQAAVCYQNQKLLGGGWIE